jgi:UDP-N-acetylglucosamine acyltransferase
MPSRHIHPTAIVEDGAVVGNGCIVHAYAFISRYCELDENVVVHPFAVLGGDPQDLSFKQETPSGVRIGARTVIREHVTISRATKGDTRTQIGADCFLMAGCHVAHDCHIGDRVVIANAVLLAGHVRVEERVFLGGGAVIHQFCRIGENAMVGGGARISQDVPPFCMVTERNELIALNMVGLRRRGLARGSLSELKRAFHALKGQAVNVRERAAQLLNEGGIESPEARRFLEFFGGGRRQFARMRQHATGDAGAGDEGAME